MSKNLGILLVSLFILFFNAPKVIGQESDTINVEGKATNDLIMVYVTKTVEKYHIENCRYLSKSKISITLDNTVKSYDPCSVCKPSTLDVDTVKDEKIL